MASPRLSFGGPIILAFNWSNGMPRLCETCTAATNCPRFLNPCAACCRFVPVGRRLCSLLASLVLSSRWSETEDPLESFPELLCEFEFEFMLWPVPPPPPPPPCPCCAYSGMPISATDNAMIKVLDFIFLPPFYWLLGERSNLPTLTPRLNEKLFCANVTLRLYPNSARNILLGSKASHVLTPFSRVKSLPLAKNVF